MPSPSATRRIVRGVVREDFSLDATELGYINGVTAGTVTASKAVVVSADKDAGDFRNLDAVNIDAGASGTAGTVDIFPATASKGKLIISATNNTTDHNVTLTNAAVNGASVTVTIPALTGYAALSTAALTLAEVDVLDAVTPGTGAASKAVVLDAQGDVTLPGDVTISGTLTPAAVSGAKLTATAGATAAAVALQLGSATENTNISVIDEDVTLTNAASTNLTNTVPSGAVILSVQANLDTTVVGDASGDDGMVKIGIGTAGDPDKYGLSANLVQNTKVDTIPDWAVLSGAEQIAVNAVDTNGDAVTEKFVGGEIVRVRVVYLTLNSLDDAA